MKSKSTLLGVLGLALTLVAGLESQADAQVTASSYSTGGTAISTAQGFGNTRISSSAVARNGGYARSSMYGRGTNGGFASGSSRAIADGGVAISQGQSIANGWGARSNARSRAYTVGGFSRSNSRAIANGTWANARSNAASNTYYQYGTASAQAIDNRPNPYTPVYPIGQAPVQTYPIYYGN